MAALGKWFSGLLPLPEAVLQVINFIVSFAVVAGLFALMFKVLPDAKVAWRDVWIGGHVAPCIEGRLTL